MRSKLPTIVGLLVVALIAIAVATYTLYLNNFSITPDIAGLACAGDHLAKTGEFRNFPIKETSYEMCWQPTTYPLLQHGFALFERITHLDALTIALIITVLGYLGAVLGIWLITWQLSHHPWIATLGGLLAAFSPALVRSMVLTPQNTVGYCIVILILSCVLAFTTQRQWWYALPTTLLLGLLFYVHTLSFGIAIFIVAIWFLVVAVRPWYLQFIIALLCIGLLASQILWRWLPAALGDRLAFFLNGSSAGFSQPWWNHPSIWGYVLLAFGAAGFALWSLKSSQRLTLLIAGLVPVLLGHATVIGIGLLPNRFIPFAWLVLTPLAALGMYYIIYALTGLRWYSGVLLGFIVSAQITHGFWFIKDDLSGLSYRYVPRAGYVEALQALNAINDEATVLGVQSAENQEILLAPLWYGGQVLYYPWYALNHHDIKKFETVNASSPYADIVNDPSNPIYEWLHDYYTIVATPNGELARTGVKRQHIDYLLIPKHSKVYTDVWVKADAKRYQTAWESNEYIVYALSY